MIGNLASQDLFVRGRVRGREIRYEEVDNYVMLLHELQQVEGGGKGTFLWGPLNVTAEPPGQTAVCISKASFSPNRRKNNTCLK